MPQSKFTGCLWCRFCIIVLAVPQYRSVVIILISGLTIRVPDPNTYSIQTYSSMTLQMFHGSRSSAIARFAVTSGSDEALQNDWRDLEGFQVLTFYFRNRYGEIYIHFNSIIRPSGIIRRLTNYPIGIIRDSIAYSVNKGLNCLIFL